MSMRREVLAVYKRALRLANDWGKYASQPEGVLTEKEYIRSESKKLFRKNRYISDDVMIQDHIKEAETRIEMAIHYKTPYPRPVNIPQSVLPPLSAKLKKGQRRSIKQSKPIYLKSYDDIET
ncbi:LYR motif-containing protein 1-like [Mizuhopecten yessoensis]|uniref:LYR motif-containing protein 1 n=1 Tax=Mizuhopecten yessoensis TaxID=6573 RepID=A0A210QNJ2_MIZYE|nr:LYR motif-containing protein 1-like [Mizuhopecten yessoensis]OWF50309.1 LYR motif-containing protein 1 [Mizuhopecten yessoensis]